MPFFYLSPKIHGYSVWETLLPLLPYLHLVPQRKLLFKKFKLQTGIFEHMSDVTYRLWYKLKRRIYILYDACICIKSFGKYYHKSLSYVLQRIYHINECIYIYRVKSEFMQTILIRNSFTSYAVDIWPHHVTAFSCK